MRKYRGGVKITFPICLQKLTWWEKIKLLCNKQDFEKFKQYDKQSFINEDWKQEFLDLNWVLNMKKWIKNIYLISNHENL